MTAPTRQKAYTDEPELSPNLILGSAHLLFWLFFHPSAWRNYVRRLDPELPADFSLVQLSSTQWRQPSLRRLLISGYVIFPLLAGLTVGLTLWVQSTPLEMSVVPVTFIMGICLTLGLMMGTIISLAAGITGGLLVSLAFGIVASISLPIPENLASATAVSLAIGAAASIAASLVGSRSDLARAREAPTLVSQAGSIVIGVMVGVVAAGLIRVGITTLTTLLAGLPESAGYNLARTIVVGTSFGVAVGWRRGSKAGIVSGTVCGAAYITSVTAMSSDINWILIGLASGLLFGLSFGVTVVLPYVVSEQIAGAWAGAWAGALGSWGRHVVRNEVPLWPGLPLGLIGVSLGLTLARWRPVVLYPLEAAWNLLLYRFDGRRSAGQASLLRWHAAFWDELQHLRLVGLDDHLLIVIERNPDEGQRALTYLNRSRQRWAVQAVQIELEARRLETCEDIITLSQVHRSAVSGELAGPASTLLRNFHHLSRDIEAALNQTSSYHQRLALNTLCERLNGLGRELTISNEPYAERFYPIAANWDRIVTQHVQILTEAVEQSQEIDNPYIVGVPLTRQQEIFIGRTDIVTRIGQLLLDRRRPPLLLYGQRRMGKTSLLRNLGNLLPRQIVPMFIDCQMTSLASDYTDFLYSVSREITRSAEQQRHLLLPALSRESTAVSPFTGFNEWLDEVETMLAATDHIALLALDEFEMLDQVPDKGRFDTQDVLSLLRHIIQHRTRFKVLLAGSHTLEELQRWASYLINVQVIKIGYLAKEEARQLIEQPVKNFTLGYEPAACQRVLDLTRGHPALIQLLCYEIVTLKNEQATAVRRVATVTDVEAAVSNALVSGSFFFGDIEQNQIDPAGLALLRFMAMQGEAAVVSHDALAAQAGEADQLDQVLTGLVRRDLIETASGGYRFQIELIRRWFEHTA